MHMLWHVFVKYNFSLFSILILYNNNYAIKMDYYERGSVDCSFDRAAKHEIRPVWQLCASERELDFKWVSFTLNV